MKKIDFFTLSQLAILLLVLCGFGQTKSRIAVISVNNLKLPHEIHQITDVCPNALQYTIQSIIMGN